MGIKAVGIGAVCKDRFYISCFFLFEFFMEPFFFVDFGAIVFCGRCLGADGIGNEGLVGTAGAGVDGIAGANDDGVEGAVGADGLGRFLH